MYDKNSNGLASVSYQSDQDSTSYRPELVEDVKEALLDGKVTPQELVDKGIPQDIIELALQEIEEELNSRTK